NVAEIIIAKHRNGAVGDVRLTFRKELARFMDMEHYPTDFEQPVGMTFSSKMNEEPALNAMPSDFGLPPNNNFAPFNDSGDVPF
ncbi:MAG TPA: DnaB-like helicase C-terminal domain-containing protein, partial [Prolixibacteraceae bacterium]|nr:DnaB-like helicase C-terminal domain-containing protein [Prolixibacteraceae bacterium]